MKLPANVTPEQVKQIETLAEFVQKKENHAREVYFKLLNEQFELLDKRKIAITEISFSEKLIISFDIEEDDQNNITNGYFIVSQTPISFLYRTREEKEDPSHIEIIDLEKLYSDNDIFHKNHNFYKDKKEHPFYNLYFSRGMNEILNNFTLSFGNILKIDKVWIDFDVEFSLMNYKEKVYLKK